MSDVSASIAVRVAHIMPAAMLILAPFADSSDYFDILRWVVCGSCSFVAYKIKDTEIEEGWYFVFVAVAILFNPLIPFHNERSTWALLDVSAALFIYLSWRRLKRTTPKV